MGFGVSGSGFGVSGVLHSSLHGSGFGLSYPAAQDNWSLDSKGVPASMRTSSTLSSGSFIELMGHNIGALMVTYACFGGSIFCIIIYIIEKL